MSTRRGALPAAFDLPSAQTRIQPNLESFWASMMWNHNNTGKELKLPMFVHSAHRSRRTFPVRLLREPQRGFHPESCDMIAPCIGGSPNPHCEAHVKVHHRALGSVCKSMVS